MANKLDVTPATIVAETLSVLTDSLVLGNLMYRDKTADYNNTPNGFAVGDTVSIKQRPDYAVNEFAAGGTIDVQDIRESRRSLVIEKHFDTSVSIGARERALSFDGFTDQVINPAAERIAESIDSYLGSKIVESAGAYNSADLFGSAADVANAREAAIRQRINGPRIVIAGLGLESKLLGADWFNQSQTRGTAGEATLMTGQMGTAMGMSFFSSINLPETTQTNSTFTALVNLPVDGNTLIGLTSLPYDGGAGSLVQGDRIRIAGSPTPLIVGAPVVGGATGNITLADPITEVINDNAAISVISAGLDTTIKGVITEPTGFILASPALDTPTGASAAVATAGGFSLRVVSDYDIQTKVDTMSIDILIGATAWDPRISMLLTEGS